MSGTGWMRPEGDTSLPHGDPLAGFPGLLDCVHCGLCLEACPTYRVSGAESDSPRGRIALLRAETEGRVTADEIAPWVDRCVQCRACEPACPSRVEYHRLVERHHAGRRGAAGPSFLERYAASAGRQRLFGGLARLARRLGLLAAVERWGPARLRALARAVPARPRAWRPAAGRVFAARGARRGVVALHLGCSYPELLGDGLRDVVAVLTWEGFEVRVPPQPPCCGALHAHAGDPARGAQFAAATLGARGDADAWIVPAAGCAAHLAAADPAAPVVEPLGFLDRQGLRGPLAPIERDVAHAPPCHLLHLLGGAAATDRALDAVPGLRRHPLPDAALCCGAGGASFARAPRAAAELGEAKARAIAASGADWIVAGNPGCLLQIEAALRARRIAARVSHPAAVLREALGAPRPE